jgi:hypothetical protein
MTGTRIRGWVVAVGALIAVSALSIGCGSGKSEDEAKVYCDQLQASLTNSFGAASYDQCVSCYEDCGQLCESKATSPATFACRQ